MSGINLQKNDLILSTGKRKLKPILSHNRLKINNTIVQSTRYKYRVFHKSLSKGDLSVALFQGNDVDLVRNLDLYQERDIWNNFLLKGKLKNDIIKGKDYGFRINKKRDNDINLPKLNSLTIDGILESEQKLNQNKKEAQKNLAYSQLEMELCSELKKLRQSYKEKKEAKDNIYKNFKKLNDEVDKMSLEIQVMNSREIFDNSKDQKNKQKELEKNNDKMEKIKKKNNGSKLNDDKEKEESEKIESPKNSSDAAQNKLLKIKSLYQLKKEQDIQKKLKYDKLNTLKTKLSNINGPLKKLNEEIFEIKKEESIVIRKLMAHYETLLYQGEEVRNEGLIWIIKAIWNLGENVPMSFIPPFLDFQSIEFLFKYAHKSIELENVKKILNELKNKLQIKIHKLFYTSKSRGRYSSSFEFKTDLIKRNTISQRSIKEHNFINAYINGSDTDEENKNFSSLKEMENIIGKKKSVINLNKLQGIDRIEELKVKIKSIEKEIFNLKKNETLRLFKEFVENDYANKYHVSIDMVLAALLGEHSKNIEVNKYSKFKKEYLEELKNIRFYQYGHDKNSS